VKALREDTPQVKLTVDATASALLRVREESP